MGNVALQPMTLDEFIQWEGEQSGRHEYMDGEIVAMTGGTVAHDDVRNNLMALLRPHLRGTGCRAFGSDVALRLQTSAAWFYPDIFVTCETDSIGAAVVRSAMVIVEVLSPRTQGRDRVEKWAHYQLIEELREYVLIDPRVRRIEVHRRDAAGHWAPPAVVHEGEAIRFESVAFETTFDVVFEHVPPEPDLT